MKISQIVFNIISRISWNWGQIIMTHFYFVGYLMSGFFKFGARIKWPPSLNHARGCLIPIKFCPNIFQLCLSIFPEHGWNILTHSFVIGWSMFILFWIIFKSQIVWRGVGFLSNFVIMFFKLISSIFPEYSENYILILF